MLLPTISVLVGHHDTGADIVEGLAYPRVGPGHATFFLATLTQILLHRGQGFEQVTEFVTAVGLDAIVETAGGNGVDDPGDLLHRAGDAARDQPPQQHRQQDGGERNQRYDPDARAGIAQRCIDTLQHVIGQVVGDFTEQRDLAVLQLAPLLRIDVCCSGSASSRNSLR